MTSMQEMIHEQLLDYSKQLKEAKEEIKRKMKSGKDYSADVTKASGLKIMQEEAVKMMAEIKHNYE